MREAIANALRRLADRLADDRRFRCFSGYFTIDAGKGIVITQTDGVQVSPAVPGVPLYFLEDEYQRIIHPKP